MHILLSSPHNFLHQVRGAFCSLFSVVLYSIKKLNIVGHQFSYYKDTFFVTFYSLQLFSYSDIQSLSY